MKYLSKLAMRGRNLAGLFPSWSVKRRPGWQSILKSLRTHPSVGGVDIVATGHTLNGMCVAGVARAGHALIRYSIDDLIV